jgi:hypothetical protein
VLLSNGAAHYRWDLNSGEPVRSREFSGMITSRDSKHPDPTSIRR